MRPQEIIHQEWIISKSEFLELVTIQEKENRERSDGWGGDRERGSKSMPEKRGDDNILKARKCDKWITVREIKINKEKGTSAE